MDNLAMLAHNTINIVDGIVKISPIFQMYVIDENNVVWCTLFR